MIRKEVGKHQPGRAIRSKKGSRVMKDRNEYESEIDNANIEVDRFRPAQTS